LKHLFFYSINVYPSLEIMELPSKLWATKCILNLFYSLDLWSCSSFPSKRIW
jgi:hypothetical protein